MGADKQMSKWKVRVTAIIDDELEVEADTEAEAIEFAHADWSFVEAHSWSEQAERIGDNDDE